jgi:small-conductance mechanosensitive channel
MLQDILQLPFWDTMYFGNSVFDYTVMFLSFFALLVALKSIQSYVLEKLHRFAAKTATDLDDVFVKIIGSLKPPFYAFLAAYFAAKILSMSGFAEKLFTALLVLWVTYQIIVALEIFIDYIITKRDKDDAAGNSAAMHLAGIFLKTLLWIFALLTALSNLGINVTSLIAGLGIGGIAVALAAQNILGDLFGSFAIYLDRPFVIGDTIKVGEKIGTVIKIGVKTTRVQAQSGEEIIFPNKDIVSAQIHNMARLKERRVAFAFGVTYETDDKKLVKIPLWIKEIIESEADTRFDRAHFKEFGDSALLFEVVYFVTTPDYLIHMNTRQNINLSIRERFKKEKVEMAYPTQTVHMRNK